MRPFTIILSNNLAIFQSTHPWRVRPHDHQIKIDVVRISIHAPMKSATRYINFLLVCFAISIHAPMKSATEIKASFGTLSHISIHAPMKSATSHTITITVDDGFQSTHPWRVRQVYLPDEFILFIFQSTHPWRVRRASRRRRADEINYFNPRTHEECDQKF